MGVSLVYKINLKEKKNTNGCFLESQFLSNYLDMTDSLRHTVTHGTFSYFGYISVVYGPIWTFFTVLPP